MTVEQAERWIAGWRGPLLAALVALIAGLPGLLAMPPLDRDESRYAQASSQMLETRDFTNIRFQDQARHKKPVGIYWMQAVSTGVLSNVEQRDVRTYRVPSLLGAMLAAAACAWGASALWGARAGVLAGALLGATFLLSSEAFIAKTDAVLCGAVTLSMAALGRLYAEARGGPAAGRRAKPLFWAGLAAAILVKGPVGPVVALGALLTLWAWDRDARWMLRLGWGWGLIALAAVVGPWAAAITVATDGAFWGTAVGGDIAPKLAAGGHESHGAWPGWHALLLPVLFFPGALLLAAAARTAWVRRADPGVRFAIAWFAPLFLLLELAPTKLVHYPLPVYGALAWLVAAAVSEPLKRRERWIGAGLALAAAAAIGLSAVYALTRFGDPSDQPWVALAAGLAAVGALVGGILLIQRASMTALLAVGGFAILSHAVFAAAVLPRLEPLLVSPRLERALVRSGLDPRLGFTPGPVALAGYHEPSAVFLLGTRTELVSGEGAADAVAEGRPAAVEQRQEPAFRATLAQRRARALPAATIEGYNYSKGEPVRLTLYRPQGSRR